MRAWCALLETAGGDGIDGNRITLFCDGKRTIDTGSDPAALTEEEFDRERWGVGGTLRWNKFRLYGEYVKADGMIFNGTDGGAVPGAINNAGTEVATFNMEPDEEADGWYLDFGYKVLPNLELDVRYDKLNRSTEGSTSNPAGLTRANEREFERWTIEAQYFFNKKSRMTVNYEFRDAEAPDQGFGPADDIVGGIDDRFSAQLLVIF